MSDILTIGGDLRPGSEFRFTKAPHHAANSTFVALRDGRLFATRHATQLWDLPDDAPVIAHWHGERRTDGFATSVGELKKKAKEYAQQ